MNIWRGLIIIKQDPYLVHQKGCFIKRLYINTLLTVLQWLHRMQEQIRACCLTTLLVSN